MTTEDEEYRVYLYFESGKSVHNLRYCTNLYDYDGAMSYIRFFDNDGKFVLDAYFDKGAMQYDRSKGKVVVPANGIKIKDDNSDDDYYDDDDDEASDAKMSATKVPSFKGDKVLYMSFIKRETKNLHYAI